MGSTNTLRKIYLETSLFIQKQVFPIKIPHEDAKRRSTVLRFILLGTIAFVGWSVLHVLQTFIAYGGGYRGYVLLFSLIVLIFYVFLYSLSLRGHTRAISLIVIGIYFIGTTWSLYLWGPTLPSVLLTYSLIIVSSSILISSHFSLLISITIGILMSCIGFLQGLGVIGLDLGWRSRLMETGDGIQYSLSLIFIMAIGWLSNREYEKSLRRTYESEKALQDERDQLEIRVLERTEALRQAQMEKVSQLYHFAEFGRLSSGLFHDLMNPLLVVTLNIQHLENTIHPEIPEIKDNLDRTLKASKRMEQFIMVIKRQIKVENFKEQFFLNNIIEDVITLLHYKATKMNVSLHFTANKKIQGYYNPLRFQQILTNLVSNAIDSYENIKTKERMVYIDLTLKESFVHIKVSDNGCGIPQEIVSKIFDTFFTTKAHHTGIGLGLSTTKEIVEKEFKGIITVESKFAEGASFAIVFPHINTFSVS